ncbi:hypothetical protein [Mesorhizobium sp. M00.F.Ca.ET.216.01.1.1]|uniref:hypothetical protein n=1 Tax=Mesorhizobium sp. M00.F.Ca.ET.216.01.1.1 TaxID=2500528 RepID=UPI000FD94F53|nr:hypothetical protein [Mesorhizobium sp. M00.F.Ca.ET.216.01.1.1]TGQ35582.1 hypothetical protein EN859_022935 [Mesorhizobium sp. M00.F.Ca.ET.216.01.1.1]
MSLIAGMGNQWLLAVGEIRYFGRAASAKFTVIDDFSCGVSCRRYASAPVISAADDVARHHGNSWWTTRAHRLGELMDLAVVHQL